MRSQLPVHMEEDWKGSVGARCPGAPKQIGPDRDCDVLDFKIDIKHPSCIDTTQHMKLSKQSAGCRSVVYPSINASPG